MRTSMRLTLATAAALLLSAAVFAKTTVQYDAKGRVVRVDYGGGRIVTFTYDGANNLVAETASAPGETLGVAVSPSGGGTVLGSGIACPSDCTETYSGFPTVALATVPAPGWVFLGWGGALSGSLNPASLKMTTDAAVAAYFGAESGDTDGDGTPDVAETGAGGGTFGYDGNRDGVPDYQQASVVSLPTFNGASYVTLAVEPPAVLTGVAAVDNPSLGDTPPGVGFPFGFFAFTIQGVALGGWVNLDMFFPPSQLTSYWKHGPTPDNVAPHWYEFVHYHPALPGAEIWPKSGYVQVRLFLQDGAKGDDIATPDSMIVDQGGPSGQIVAAISVTPTALDFGLLRAGQDAILPVTVQSTGQAALVLGAVGGGNPLAAPFSIASDGCSGRTLQPAENCVLGVRFAPTAAGTFNDSFDIPSNAGAAVVTVTGQGELAEPIPTLGGVSLTVLALLLIALGGWYAARRAG
ncbi:MAG TPA: choice-of-anchor D domain-containing protein [Thermoanaerobaculaceae bacterium]|nr:choice-of-anchor D domain-containing protein [Thermoanaerobaculaceae bacterium]HRS15029.1 choice-of-anchor D domain-containing protein [Thermoanaerobaculaceae bacterium]